MIRRLLYFGLIAYLPFCAIGCCPNDNKSKKIDTVGQQSQPFVQSVAHN